MATTAATLDDFPLIGATPGGGRSKILTMDGWLSAATDRSRGKRSGGHGGWSARGRRAQKSIVAVGMVTYPTAEQAAAERRAMLALGGYGATQLVVTDSLGAIGQTVEVDDIDIPPVTDTMLRFTFELVAVDPFARATTATTVAVAAGATVTHTAGGTVPAEIEVTCTSTGTVDLTIGGLRLRTGSLNVGAKLTSGPGFDNPRRTIVSLTGANLFRLIVQPMQWPAISPGGNSIHQAGTANLSIRYFPTYP